MSEHVLELFRSQLVDVTKKFTSLRVVEGDELYLEGYIEIVDKNQKKWDCFHIQIKCSEGFPYRFPKLFEIGGKIPRIPDWHINADGSCCIIIEPKEIVICSTGISVDTFIEEFVIPFFYNQAHRIIVGFYANSEYSHGSKGIYEYYCGILNIKDKEHIIRLLRYILYKKRPTRVSNCFCGCGKKFRHCHRSSFDQIKSIPFETLEKHINMINDLF